VMAARPHKPRESLAHKTRATARLAVA